MENAALRLQLAAFQRKRKRPVLTSFDRLFWVGLSLIWNGWRAALAYVQPDTVVRGCTTNMEADMSQRTFSLVAGVVFGLIALAHVLRIVFGWSLTIQDFSVPMWASWIAIVVTGYLAYEGFRLAKKSASGA